MPEEEKKKGKGILIGLIVLLLILNGVQFFLNYKKDKEQETQLTEQASQIISMNSEAKAQLAKLESLEKELTLAKEKAKKLGLNVEDLEAEIGALKQTKNYYLKNFMKPSVRKEMNAKISNYEAMLNQQNEEIRQLKANNEIEILGRVTDETADKLDQLGDSLTQDEITQVCSLAKKVLVVSN